MPTFSDLPNELIAITWGFVDEPEDIESFALVSKRVYSQSTPFVQEHARYKTSLPTIFIDVDTEPSGPYELLERYLHVPRLAFYVHEALINDYRTPGSQQNVSPASLSPERMAKFESAVRCSSYVPPSEKDDWVREIKEGNPDPIIALIIMRLTKLRHLRLVYPYTRGNGYLLGTLKRMTLSPDRASNPGSSVTKIGPDGGSQVIFKKPWPFLHINEIVMDLGGIEPLVLFKLLPGLKELKSFVFISLFDTTFEFFGRLHRELLRCYRGSLQKLSLYDASGVLRYMGSLTGFQNLTELNISINLLLGFPLGGGDEERRRLVDALPTSIQRLRLHLGDTAGSAQVEDMIDQVVECKLERCQWLDAFWIETVDLVQMDDEEEIQWKEMLDEFGGKYKMAEVGIEFRMGEYSFFWPTSRGPF